MKQLKDKLFTHRNIIAILFIVFLFLRLFVNSPDVLLATDSIKYLQMSKNFPYHYTINNQVDLTQPPLFPYIIYFFTFIFKQDYIAAIFVSLVSAIVTFFIIYKLFMMLTNNFYFTLSILILYTLSVEFIIASKLTLKESFIVMLLFLTIYYTIRSVKFKDKKSLIAASIFGALTGIASDHVVLLFPVFIISYVFFTRIRIKKWKFSLPYLHYALIPFLITLLFYGIWTGAKVYQYSNNEYYPSGVGGAPVSTENFGLFHLLNPRYFEDYEPGFPTGFNTELRSYPYHFGYMFNTEPFSVPRGLNFTSMKYLLFPRHVVYMILLYLPLAIIALYGFFTIIMNFLKTKKIFNNVGLYILILFLIFIIPLLNIKTSIRYVYTSYVFLYYFIIVGLFIFLEKWKGIKYYNKFIRIFIILLLLVIPVWYYNNNYLSLSVNKILASGSTANFIETNIDKNAVIMTGPGHGYLLNYQVTNKIIGLPPEPNNLLPIMKYYGVDYVLFGKYHSVTKYQLAIDSIEFIKNNPDKFELVATIPEIYGKEARKNDEVYIYQVVNN